MRRNFLFLDEATASLDEPSEAALYRLLQEKLPATTIVSIGHRSTLEAFHQRKLALVRDGDRFALREQVRGEDVARYKPALRPARRGPSDARRAQRRSSISAPARTGTSRNVHGRLFEITSSGLIPAGG